MRVPEQLNITAKIGTSNVPVLMKLIESYCLSVLLYNLEVFDLNKSCINRLNFALHRMYMKIFKTSSIQIVQDSLFYFGMLPIDLKLKMRKVKHLNKLSNNCNSGNMLFFSLRNVIETEKNKLIADWCSLGTGLQYPCLKEAWAVFSKRLAA